MRRGGQGRSKGKSTKDPRVDGILQAIEAMSGLFGQQAQNQAAATTAANAAAAAATAVATTVIQTDTPAVKKDEVAKPPMHRLVENFLKLKPPKFSGTGDPETASLWVAELEKTFDLLKCSEEEKVTLAVYQLQGNANTWWAATKGGVFPTGTDPTWGAFVKEFNSKYFSACAREQKMMEFQRLHQNQLSVDQYEAKLSELSRYAPRLVEDLEEKAMRFRDGLKPEIRGPLVPLDLQNYKDLYKRAQLLERDLAEKAPASGSRFTSNRDGHRFGKRPMQGGTYSIPPNRRGGVSKPSSNWNGPCRWCGRKHETA